MKRLTVLIAVLVTTFAGALSAQTLEWGAWATNLEIQGDNVIDPDFGIEIVFDEGAGYGFTVNRYWGNRWSTELGAYSIDADTVVKIGFLDETIEADKLDMVPVTLMLQYHFRGADAPFDAWVGAGPVFVFVQNDLNSADLIDNGLGPVEFDDEFTWGANFGFSYHFTDAFGIGVDIKWIPLDLDSEGPGSEALGGTEEVLEIDPLMASVGILYRF